MFPRELMLLARALVNLEATAGVVDPELDLTRLIRPLQPGLRATRLPGRSSLPPGKRSTCSVSGTGLAVPSVPAPADDLRQQPSDRAERGARGGQAKKQHDR